MSGWPLKHVVACNVVVYMATITTTHVWPVTRVKTGAGNWATKILSSVSMATYEGHLSCHWASMSYSPEMNMSCSGPTFFSNFIFVLIFAHLMM